MKRAALDEGMRRELETLRSTQWNVTASLEEGLARCRVLLEQVGGPESLRDIAFADAADLVGWGFALAMDAGQYDEAVRWIELLIRHPDFPDEGAMDRSYRTHQQATAMLFAGEVEEATALYRSALEMVKDRPGHSRTITLWIWHELNDYCLAQPEAGVAPTALAKLVYEVVCRRSARVRRAAPRYEPHEGASYAELLVLLALGDKCG